jgi:hypothetical protein
MLKSPSAIGYQLSACLSRYRVLVLSWFVMMSVVISVSAADPTDRTLTDLGLDPTAWRSAVKRGLDHLASRQQPDGSFAGRTGAWSGIVASGALAFMAHGRVPRSGPEGEPAARCLRYLLDRRDPYGTFAGTGDAPVFQHGLIVLALAEAYGEFADARLAPAVQAGVERICRGQNPRGGWRHLWSFSDGDELPSSVLMLMALRAAHNAGFAVPVTTTDAAKAYVQKSQLRWADGGDGGFVYSYGNGAQTSAWPRTGSGVVSLLMCGAYDDPAIGEALYYLMRFQPVGTETVPERDWWSFGAWFVTLAFQQAQDRGEWERAAWHKFYPAMVNHFISTQRPDGGWSGPYEPFETQCALLVLSMPCEALPIHQR